MTPILGYLFLYAGCIGVVQQGASLVSGIANGARHAVRRNVKGAAVSVLDGVLAPLAITAQLCSNAISDTANAIGDTAALAFKGAASYRLSKPIDDPDSVVIDQKATVPVGA
jgi:hypothetical protein